MEKYKVEGKTARTDGERGEPTRRTIYQVVSDSEMTAFGYVSVNDLGRAREELADEFGDLPGDTRLIECVALASVPNDIVFPEPVTVSGRYTGYSGTLDCDVTVSVVTDGTVTRVNGPAIIDA